MEERKEGIDPVWAQTGPPPAGTNLGAHWLTRVSRLLPSDALPESPQVLEAIFCHSLSFDPSRSRSHHLFFNLVVSELLVVSIFFLLFLFLILIFPREIIFCFFFFLFFLF